MPHLPPATALPLLDALAACLRTRALGHPARGYRTVDSTNTLAARWAQADAPHGALVLAEAQTQGRGRLGRRWSAAPGQNLLFSVVLRRSLRPGTLPLAASLAVADTVGTHVGPYPVAIKWPNDVLLEGRKCCGMLMETAGPAIVLGIGLNVNQLTFPDDIADRATSLRLTTGQVAPLAPLLADLLAALERWLDQPATVVRTAYARCMAGRGTTVTLRLTDDGQPLTGTLEGIADDGALRLATPYGVRTFHAGDVTFHQD